MIPAEGNGQPEQVFLYGRPFPASLMIDEAGEKG
jgi:hypothetical protein